MSITIKHLALHQLVAAQQVNPEEGAKVELLVNESLVEVTPIVEGMVEKLHQLYSMKNKGFAVFSHKAQSTSAQIPNDDNNQVQNESSDFDVVNDEISIDHSSNDSALDNIYRRVPFVELFQALQNDEMDFLIFSEKAATNLVHEINQYSFAEPGLLLMCHYHHVANDYLYMAILQHTQSTSVKNDFTIEIIDALDIEKSDIMARLDITEWTHNQDSSRYLTFLRGRIGRKVGDFFLDFLGAETGLDPKRQTQTLIQAIDDYCEAHTLAKEEEQLYKKDVVQYCQVQAKQGEELSIEGLSSFLSPKEHPVLSTKPDVVDFASFTESKGYDLADSFPADTSAIKKLTKFTGSGGGVTISFTSEQLGQKIVWDKETDTLTIKGTPPNLRDQLERFYD
ncbi:nucleoid-associated protein YejK [Thorsellia kenyensis]|uniref:Nucleoid-associated protein YejK n=1 Tax=Thorsellia kenyensis TaxID=1549888 RepID=A0ABV6CC81_9GAMM